MARKIFSHLLRLAAIALLVVAVIVAADKLNQGGDYTVAFGTVAEGCLGALLFGFLAEVLA